jgi:glycosyltransferase involved in cell wall biosynthesis
MGTSRGARKEYPVNKPKISIVTISYNQRPFLMRNIVSVNSQGFEEYEHIIVDPGSSDGSRELIESMDDSRIVKIFEPDSGPADGLNKGFSKARGEVIIYLNSDDELAPNSLAAFARLHDDNPEADIIIGNGWTIDGQGEPIQYIKSDTFTPRRSALSVGVALQQATSFKKRIFASGLKFNTENSVSWDAEILYDAFSKGFRFMGAEDTLGYFRLHDGTITVSGQYEEQIRREGLRLARTVFPRAPFPVIRTLRYILRAWKFVRNRFYYRTSHQTFPGLARVSGQS